MKNGVVYPFYQQPFEFWLAMQVSSQHWGPHLLFQQKLGCAAAGTQWDRLPSFSGLTKEF